MSLIDARKFRFMVDEVPNFAQYIMGAIARQHHPGHGPGSQVSSNGSRLFRSVPLPHMRASFCDDGAGKHRINAMNDIPGDHMDQERLHLRNLRRGVGGGC